MIAPGLIKNTVYKGVCCFDSPWFNKKIQFIKGYAVLIAPGLIKIQFLQGSAVLIAPGLIKIQFLQGSAVLIAPVSIGLAS